MTEGTVTKTVWNKSIPKKIEWDINVPDSKRDILKLLSQTLTAHIADYQIKDNLFTARVEVCANLLYLPEGNEQPLISSLQSTESFLIKSELPADLTWDFSKADCNVVSHTPVCINSRKAGIRGHLTVSVCLYENVTVACPETAGKPIEVLIETVDTYTTPVTQEEQFPFSLNLPLPSGKPPVLEILESSVCVKNPDVKAISNKAVAKGNLEVKILYTSAHSTLEIAEFSSPFTEILDVGNLEDTYQIAYEMKPVLHTAEVIQNEENEAKNLSFFGTIFMCLTAREEKQLSLITDAYSPRCQTKLLTKTSPFERILCLPEESFTLKEMVFLSDTQLEEILDVSSVPVISNAQINGDSLLVNGHLKTRILYKSNSSIHSVTKEIPFTLEPQLKNNNWDTVSVKGDLTHFSYHILNQNNLEIRAGINLSVCLSKQEQKQYTEAILMEEDCPIVCDRAPIVAYIIKPGDTLFQIAKKYATTVDRLKAVNNIENDRNLKVGSYLIIE